MFDKTYELVYIQIMLQKVKKRICFNLSTMLAHVPIKSTFAI